MADTAGKESNAQPPSPPAGDENPLCDLYGPTCRAQDRMEKGGVWVWRQREKNQLSAVCGM